MNKLIVGDLNESYCVDLNKKQLIIGRLGDCDIALKSNSVSRNHAKIYLKETLWILEDMNSTNGVYVNNTKVESPLALMHKDLIKIGESTLEFIDEEFAVIDSAVNNIASTFHRHSKSVKPVSLKDFLKGVNEVKNKMAMLASSMEGGQTQIKAAEEAVKAMAAELALMIKGYINSGVSDNTASTLVHGIESKLKYDGISQMLEAASSKSATADRPSANNTNYLFALDEIKTAAENVSDYKKSCYLILSIAMKILELNRGFIIIKDPVSGVITPLVSKINKNDMHESSPSMSVARYAIGKNHAIFIDDPALDARFADKSRSIISGVIKSVICVPLSKKSICLGAIYLDSDEQKKNFNDLDRDFVIKLAGHISELLEMSGLFHELVSEYEGIDEILSKVSKKSELEDLLKKIIMADVKTKISAIEKVSSTTNENIVEILKENLSGEENRFLIATYIKIIGAVAKETEIEFVKKYLLHPDARVRANSIGALLNMNARERALDKIVKMLSDEDAKVRTLASHYILSMNHNLLINEFEKYLTSSDERALTSGVINASFLLSLDELEILLGKVYAGLDDEFKTMASDYLKSSNDDKAAMILEGLQKQAGTVPAAAKPAAVKPVAVMRIDIDLDADEDAPKSGVNALLPPVKKTVESVREIKKEVREKVNPVNHTYESEEFLDDDIMSEFQSALQRVNQGAKSENRMKTIMYQLKSGKKH
jgi:pSer/pThr/pTyr-binding forkhead associated (FHA) protein